MKRFLVLAALFATLLPLGASCTAELEEGCAAGPCEAGNTPSPASAAATTGSGGAGGEGGAGGGMPDCTGVPETGQFPCEVWDVLVARCHKCHTDPTMNGAPFPLLTFEKTREPYGTAPIWQRMQNAIGTDFMPLGGPPLIGTERKTMENWFAQCAPPVPDGMGCEMP